MWRSQNLTKLLEIDQGSSKLSNRCVGRSAGMEQNVQVDGRYGDERLPRSERRNPCREAT